MKHRIVGITVVALLVLFTLFIYKENDTLLVDMEHSAFSPMKPSNDIYHEEIVSLSDRFVTSEKKTIHQNNGVKKSLPQHPPSKRVLDDKESTTWIIQLASFANDNNATNLVDVLRNQGYNAYTESAVNTNELAITRVLIGPQVRHKYAEDLVSQLANEFGLDGMILKNNPLGN